MAAKSFLPALAVLAILAPPPPKTWPKFRDSAPDYLASTLGFARDLTGWLAHGAGDPVRAVPVQVNGWVALVTTDAVTLVFDEKLGRPTATRQWRLVAMAPARSECRVVLLGIATAPSQGWDSATVAAVLSTAGQAR